jgi:hypothetical protein
MKKWTWQWLVLLAILGMLFSCGAWMDRQPYDIYEDVYKPDRPWKQMIWKAKGIADCGMRIADFGGEKGEKSKTGETRGRGYLYRRLG